ncbi:MAG: asparagine synthase (glutamine-hydrolyzing) [Magnetococcales bacterium]|nr:asparagine synthase (glutamine-hydrolyzing) [Magnetococcales bacterium]MBF0151362.1 asparagine synthase (glutamine-hydrolyzing) [Magnetococcales bacterium]MBF0174688.1 asparagine synthase (glutamine-hydrolyzing) [Magnetococcales bacterium]MBF0348291.1 asparagine synthase (glutamine-hydrolyzing) [Magnetococcales bacterium]
MCGIAGLLSRKHDDDALGGILAAMNRALSHRGPDGHGMFVAGGVGLAHRRLAIIDLTDAGHQPMVWQEGHLVIVYNGEVYNYIELRHTLERLGHVFQGNSDTEVVLHAYGQWGECAFPMFNGMFALALYDTLADRLILVRDRVGIKPLFYRHVGGEFAFASEMKAFFHLPDLSTRIDPDTFYHYLVYNTPPSPATLLGEVRQLPPGCIMTLDAARRATVTRFWHPPPLVPDETITLEAAAEEVERLLRDAIRLRLRSDVPVGVFLSGGIDSSLLTALANPMVSGLKTFSAGYPDDPGDESHFAERVAQHLGTDHHTVWIDPSDLDRDQLIHVADDPLANVTIVPYLKLAEETRRQIKVVLAGDGGDEFFAGYDVRRHYARMLRLKKIVGPTLWDAGLALGRWGAVGDAARRLFNLCHFSAPHELLASFQVGIPLAEVASLIAQPFAQTLPAQYAMAEETPSFLMLNRQTITSYLSDTVLKTSDRVTMAHGLEARVPLTDYRIMEFAARLPQRLQFHRRQGKAILKHILYRHVPKALVDRPKQGFSVPGHRWFAGPWQHWFDEYLAPSHLQRSGLIRCDVAARMLADYRRGRREYAAILWRLLVFQWWFERFIPESGEHRS